MNEYPARGMSTPPESRGDVRTTISLHPTVNQFADELMSERGYNNFSALVADLIRAERDRVVALKDAELKAAAARTKEPSPINYGASGKRKGRAA